VVEGHAPTAGIGANQLSAVEPTRYCAYDRAGEGDSGASPMDDRPPPSSMNCTCCSPRPVSRRHTWLVATQLFDSHTAARHPHRFTDLVIEPWRK